jgi:hypothetical protein
MTDCPPSPDRVMKHSVLRPGISIGDDKAFGTLGLFVVNDTGTLFLLTAKHVIAPRGAKKQKPIVHPAGPDAPGTADHVASLWAWNGRTDAALARIETGVSCSIEQMESGQIVQTFREPRVGDILEKSGRTTGTTRARVTEVVRPANGLTNTFLLEQFDGDRPISCKGDSGAIWYDPETGEGVGLHNGGVPEIGKAVAVPLTEIRDALGVEPWNGVFIDSGAP